jgi:hypothetical protein
MKKRTALLLLLFAILSVLPQSIYAAKKFNPVGKWEFNVPDAPYGYNNGKFEVKIIDDLYSVSINFDGMDYKFEGEMVFFDNDKFSFNLYLEGVDVYMAFTFSDKDKMRGVATYTEGELIMSAKRVVEDENK